MFNVAIISANNGRQFENGRYVGTVSRLPANPSGIETQTMFTFSLNNGTLLTLSQHQTFRTVLLVQRDFNHNFSQFAWSRFVLIIKFILTVWLFWMIDETFYFVKECQRQGQVFVMENINRRGGRRVFVYKDC